MNCTTRLLAGYNETHSLGRWFTMLTFPGLPEAGNLLCWAVFAPLRLSEMLLFKVDAVWRLFLTFKNNVKGMLEAKKTWDFANSHPWNVLESPALSCCHKLWLEQFHEFTEPHWQKCWKLRRKLETQFYFVGFSFEAGDFEWPCVIIPTSVLSFSGSGESVFGTEVMLKEHVVWGPDESAPRIHVPKASRYFCTILLSSLHPLLVNILANM